MPKLTIDGKEIEVAGGDQPHRGGQAGRASRCPHYCYHPALSHRRPVPALHGGHREGAAPADRLQHAGGRRHGGAHEDASGSMETRRSVMEFHLINHPLDCPVCDQAGECWLQIYYMQHGLYDPRMADEKVHKPKAVPLGPHVILDAERCILCSRCVRFCDEVTQHRRARHLPPRRPLRDRPLPRQDAREQVLGQRHRHLPGGRAHRPRLPLPGARLVPRHAPRSVCNGCARGCNVEVHTNKPRARTTTRAGGWRGSSRATTRTSTSGGSATRAATASGGSTTRAGSPRRCTATGAHGTDSRRGTRRSPSSVTTLRRYRPEEIGVLASPADVERGPVRAQAARRPARRGERRLPGAAGAWRATRTTS